MFIYRFIYFPLYRGSSLSRELYITIKPSDCFKTLASKALLSPFMIINLGHFSKCILFLKCLLNRGTKLNLATVMIDVTLFRKRFVK